ncbi:MAG: hypothetical protein ABII12_10635 [Planctomycetota bacterium]
MMQTANPRDTRRPRGTDFSWLPMLGIVLVVLAAAPGCNGVNEPEYQSSECRTKYQTPLGDDVVTITAADMGLSGIDFPESGERILAAEVSQGRFPTGLAVTRVVAAMNEKDVERHLHVQPMPGHDAVYWGHMMEDLPSIREVCALRTYGHDPRGTDFHHLLKSSLDSQCDLLVVYAQVDDTDADAEFVASLYEARTVKPLAAFRVPVILPDEDRVKFEDDDEIDFVGLTAEAAFRAESDLRRLVRDTLWDLAERDAQGATTQPSPWRNELPLYPRDYNAHRRLQRFLNRPGQ